MSFLSDSPTISSLPFQPSLPRSWGVFEPQSRMLGTAYHWGEGKAVNGEPMGKASLPVPLPPLTSYLS